MVLYILCGMVGTAAIYRSLCAPYFLLSRTLAWVGIGALFLFRSLTEGCEEDARFVANALFLAGALLTGSLLFFFLYRELRPAEVPSRFTIDVPCEAHLFASACCWLCIVSVVAISLYVHLLVPA